MTDSYQFSFIVPVYNVEECLAKCVDSLLNQEFPLKKIEILLIDDGSKDHSGDMCDIFAEKYPCIKAFHKENGGLSSARNYGIDRASGEYLIFVDSDDYMEICTCQVLNEVLSETGQIDAVVFNGVEEERNFRKHLRELTAGQKKVVSGKQYLLEQYQNKAMNVEAWLYMYRREFLNSNHLRFKEGILHEDVEFTPRALLCAEKITEISDCLYHYVVRENSISTQKDKTRNIQDLFGTLKEMDHLAEQQEEKLRKWMKDAILDSYLNMVYDARIYQKKYKGMLDKSFLLHKAATRWNKYRVLLCCVNVRFYCWVNDCYKKLKGNKRQDQC